MKFNLEQSMNIPKKTPYVLKHLLKDLPEELVLNNEGENTWSPFDVVGHLIHGEETDWIPRAECILQKRQEPFHPFDRFAQFEKSKGKNLNQLLDEFEKKRMSNIEKLSSFNISEEDLTLRGTHPALGTVTLKNLLATWTAHDMNHIVQITRVIAKNYQKEVGPWQAYLKILK